MWLFVLFLAVPLIEIALFVQVGGFIGLWPTLAIVVITAILGTSLVRAQGMMALSQIQSSFSDMRDPTEPLAHGAMILISGVLLLTPGFFTDAVGFAFLVPFVRSAVISYVRKRVKVQSFTVNGGAPSGPRYDDTVIETEYTEVTETKQNKRPGDSGWTKD